MDRLGGTIGSHDSYDDDEYDLADNGGDVEAPPSPVGQDERRMQVRAYNHWASLLGDGNFPAIEDLEPEKLDDFGPYSVLLDFTAGIEDPAIRFLGDTLAAECDADEKIDTLADVPSLSLLSRITDHYMQILANQAPIGFEAEFVNQRSRTVLYRGILLPFSSDGTAIDFIFGVINWKEMASQQEADELLLEMGQALNEDVVDSKSPREVLELDDRVIADPDAPMPDLSDFEDETIDTIHFGNGDASSNPTDFGSDLADDDEGVLDLGAFADEEEDPVELPVPAFGAAEDADEMEDEDEAEVGESDAITTGASRHFVAVDDDGEPYDYGLSDLGDEPPTEDVDDVVDPLADEQASTGLTSLVTRGDKPKTPIGLSIDDLATQPEAEPETEPEAELRDETSNAIPSAYEPESEEPEFDGSENGQDEYTPVSGDIYPEAPIEETEESDWQMQDDAPEQPAIAEAPVEDVAEDVPVPVEATEETDTVETAETARASLADWTPSSEAEEDPEGLYDTLAVAREAAQQARSSEDRSRKALYDAVGRAYDFSLEAEANPDDFAELIAESGLTAQDRAPMTPIVKLVFGADYDKTRLTEYATALSYAHRKQVSRGGFAEMLRVAEGGLKGVVQAERKARREEAGEVVEERDEVREALAEKLRAIQPIELDEVAQDGAEFALVMIRRTESGELEVLGEVPQDVPLVERAARKLLA